MVHELAHYSTRFFLRLQKLDRIEKLHQKYIAFTISNIFEICREKSKKL